MVQHNPGSDRTWGALDDNLVRESEGGDDIWRLRSRINKNRVSLVFWSDDSPEQRRGWVKPPDCLYYMLCVAEISRVRKDMYNDTLNGSEKRSSELPDAVGPTVQLQEKLFVPVKEFPDVSVLVHQWVLISVMFVIKLRYRGRQGRGGAPQTGSNKISRITHSSSSRHTGRDRKEAKSWDRPRWESGWQDNWEQQDLWSRFYLNETCENTQTQKNHSRNTGVSNSENVCDCQTRRSLLHYNNKSINDPHLQPPPILPHPPPTHQLWIQRSNLRIRNYKQN